MALPKFVERAVWGIGNIPGAGPLLRHVAKGRLFNLRFCLKHPIDSFYGIDTSGYVTQRNLGTDEKLIGKINYYVGAQPSVVRQILKLLPDARDYSLIDLGCGKGRVMAVASELPFKTIAGIEISPELAACARRNAAIMQKKFPGRTKIDVIEGNAVAFPLPSSRLVLFLYNSFGEELVAELLKNIEKSLAGPVEHLFLVCHNPVNAHVVDAAPALQRWYAGQFACDPSEQGYGYNHEGATIIWQSKRAAIPPR